MEATHLTVRQFLTSELDNLPIGEPVIRTLYTLFRHPGRLTRDYLIGRRRPYLRPFQVYVIISLIFFLIQPHSGIFSYDLKGYSKLPFFGLLPHSMVQSELDRTHLSFPAYEARFNKTLGTQKKSLMVVMAPLLAVGLTLMFRRRRFTTHLVFATHYLATLLFYMVIVIGGYKLFFALLRLVFRVWQNGALFLGAMFSGELPLLFVIFVPIFFYLRRAMEVAYEVPRWRAGLGSAGLIVWQMLLIVYFYRLSLFFTTYYTIRYLQ